MLDSQTGRLHKVGVNFHGESLVLGKFVDGIANGNWHGYPADYRRNPRDRPPISVLKSWVNQGHIKKHQHAKISRGQKCNL